MRRGLLFGIAALLLSFGFIAVACGDDDGDGDGQETPVATDTTEPSDGETPEPTAPAEPSAELEAYYGELDAVEDAFRVAQDAAEERLATVTDATTVEDAIEVLLELQLAVDGFVAGLQGITPAPETAAAHEETIAGFQVVSGILGDAAAAAESGATVVELFAFFETPEAVEASDALDATCDALQAIADQNGIAVDLSCNT